ANGQSAKYPPGSSGTTRRPRLGSHRHRHPHLSGGSFRGVDTGVAVVAARATGEAVADVFCKWGRSTPGGGTPAAAREHRLGRPRELLFRSAQPPTSRIGTGLLRPDRLA